MEQLLSGRVLAWTGGLALLLGAVFFLSLAFSRGWIGPSARVAIGIITGSVIVAGGAWFFERRERLFGHVLVAVGLAVLDMSFLAGTRLYDLFPIELALAGTMLSAVAAAAIAVRANSQIVAGYGLAAALVAPPLLGAEPNGATIAFISAILVGTTGIALYRYWRWLPPLAFLLSAPQLADWVTRDPSVVPALIAVAGFWALHAVAAGGEEFRVRSNVLRPTSATLLLANAAYVVWAGFTLLDGDLEAWRGVFLAGVAFAHLALSAYFLIDEGDRHPFGMLAFGTGLAAFSIAIPVQFGGPIVPIAWAAEAAALAWVYARLGNRYSAGAALLLATGAVTHLLAFEYPLHRLGDDLDNPYPFLTAEGLTLAFMLGAAAVAGYFVRDRLFRALLTTIGLLLVVYALPFETSGVALVGAWSAIYVLGLVLHDVPTLRAKPVRRKTTDHPLIVLLGWETVVPAAIAALLAIGHVFAIEAPLDQAWSIPQPDVPFTDGRTLAVVFLTVAALLGGYVMRNLTVLRVSGVVATAFVAYLMPFELEASWAVVSWAILALGMFALARFDQDGFLVHVGTAAALVVAGSSLAFDRIAMVEQLTGDLPQPAHTPFWSEATLAIGSLVAALLAGFWLHRNGRYAAALIVAATVLAAYLMPFELGDVRVVVAWSILALLVGALASWQKANEIAYLSTAAALLGIGALKTIADIAPLDQLTGDVPQPAHTPFWSDATLAIGCLLVVLLAGFWVHRERRFAPYLIVTAAALAAYLMPFELGDATVVVAWSALALMVGALASWQKADEVIYLSTAATLLGLGALKTVVDLAPIGQLTGGAPQPAHAAFWSEATFAIGSMVVVLIAGFWVHRERRFAPYPVVAAAALAAYLMPFELGDAAVVVAWSVLALTVGALAVWQPAHADVYLGTAGTLFGLGAVKTLAIVAPPDRIVVDAASQVDHALLWSGATLALAALIVVLAAGYWLYRGEKYARWLGVAAGLLAVYLLSVGLVDEFQRQVGGQTALEELQKRAQTGLSILWAVLGGTILIVGITRRVMPERLFALGLLGLATAKVFVVDLASLDAAYRVLSFIGLGVLLLVSSWAYQHWMPRDGDGDDTDPPAERSGGRWWGGPKPGTVH